MSLVCSYLFEVGKITYFKVNYVLRQDRSGVFEEVDVLTVVASQIVFRRSKFIVEAYSRTSSVENTLHNTILLRDGVANVLLLMVDVVRGECEAREGGGGQSHLSWSHHTATDSYTKRMRQSTFDR